MKIIKYIISLSLMAFAITTNANRDESISRIYGSNLHNPYNMKVKVINEACPEKIEPKIYEGNVFWALGVSTTGMSCSKSSDDDGGYLYCSGGGSRGTITVSALKQDLLEELGVPMKYRKNISGIYTQKFDISLSLTRAWSNRRGFLGGGEPTYFDFNDYRNPYNMFCSTTEDIIYYYDEGECGHSPKEPKEPECIMVEAEDEEKSFFDDFGEFMGFGTKMVEQCEEQPSYCGDGVVQFPNDNGENEECDGGDDCSITCQFKTSSEPSVCASTPIEILSDNIQPELGEMKINSNDGKCKKVLGDNVCEAGESSLSLKGELSSLGAYKTKASGMTYMQTSGNNYTAMTGTYYSCPANIPYQVKNGERCKYYRGEADCTPIYKTLYNVFTYPSEICGTYKGKYICTRKPSIGAEVTCSGGTCSSHMNNGLCTVVNNNISLGNVSNELNNKYKGKVICDEKTKGYECFAEDMTGIEGYSIGTVGVSNINGKAILELNKLHEVGVRELYYETNNYANNSGYDIGNTITKKVTDKNKFDFDITSNKFSEDQIGSRTGLQGKDIFTIAGEYTLGFIGKLKPAIADTWTPYKTIKLIILPNDGDLRPTGDVEVINNGVYANDSHEITICQKFTDSYGNEVRYGYRDASNNIVYNDLSLSYNGDNYFKINNTAPLDAINNTGNAITLKRIRFTTDSKLCGDIVSKTPFSKQLELSLRAPSHTFDYPMKFDSALNNQMFDITTPVNIEFKKPYKGSLELVDNSKNTLSNEELKVSRPLNIQMNIVASTSSDNMPKNIGVPQFRNFLLEENKDKKFYVIKHIFEHRKNGSLLDKPYEKINIDFGIEPDPTEGISLKAETTEISYQYPDGKTARYLLTARDEGNDTTKIVIDSLGKTLYGVKIIGSYQGTGQLDLSNQSGNVSDLATSSLRTTIKQNAQELIKNMTPGQTINKVKLYSGDTRVSNISSDLNSLETIIIEDGNLIVDQNLNTTNKLGIILLRTDQSNSNLSNVYITPNVSYIKAIIYADGSVKSVDNSGNLIDARDPSVDELKKQLTIKGSLFTRNTIGGALGVDDKYTLPGGAKLDTTEENFDLASEYDLNFLRIGNDGCDLSSPANGTCTDAGEYKEPLIIEYDPIVQTSPPKGFN